jgi:hypothetical protein
MVARAVNFLSTVRVIPVDVSIFNPKVCRLVRRRSVGIGDSAVCATTKLTAIDESKNKRMHDCSMHTFQQSEAKLWSGAHAKSASLSRLNTVIPMRTQHCGARWGRTRSAKDVWLQWSIELFPFRGKPASSNRELLVLATGAGTKGQFARCSFTTDVTD